MKTEILRLEHIFAYSELYDFNIDMYAGDFTALIGLDNMGRQYMIDLIRYNLPIDYGRVFFEGCRVNDQNIRKKKPNNAIFLGQQSVLIDSLSVAENIFVIRKGYRKYCVNYAVLRKQTQYVLCSLGIHLDPMICVERLSLCEKWMVELAKAWVSGIKLIMICDISHLITDEELLQIISILCILRKKNIGFLYLCSHQQEAFRFCNRCFVMKQGHIIKRFEQDQMTEYGTACNDALNKHLWNEKYENICLTKNTQTPIFDGFTCKMSQLFFSIKKGEIAVLLDSTGRSINQLFDRLAGKYTNTKSQQIDLKIDGMPYRAGSPNCVVIPHQPVKHLLFPHLSVVDNLCFTFDYKFRAFWLTNRRKNAVARALLPIVGDAVYAQSLHGLSENVLYDIIYQRILIQKPSFIYVMQPLASADQTMRSHLLSYFDLFKQRGITVCISCCMLSDLLEIADRLLVIKDGRLTGEYVHNEFMSIISSV